ncbi:hypothetical protein BH10BAC2_BH10BAC2_22310 [soil metagenome]
MRNDEFYIGWMAAAPKSFSAWIKKYLFVLLPLIIVLGILLALSQKQFGSGNFEFGTLTEVKGVYFNKPVPVLKVVDGKDIWGNENYITVPLIGFGKHGADGVLAELENEKNISLEGREITLKGTLLYNDGKLLMQIDANDQPLISVTDNKNNTTVLTQTKELGLLDIKGEIVDPKCFFGVMKPGEGKPHKDCAIRCIFGGISPVLKVTNDEGRQNYYLIVGTNGEKMNEAVQDYIASPVTIHAKAVEYGDWIVLYVQPGGLQHYSYLKENFSAIASCTVTSCLK